METEKTKSNSSAKKRYCFLVSQNRKFRRDLEARDTEIENLRRLKRWLSAGLGIGVIAVTVLGFQNADLRKDLSESDARNSAGLYVSGMVASGWRDEQEVAGQCVWDSIQLEKDIRWLKHRVTEAKKETEFYSDDGWQSQADLKREDEK